MTIQILEFETPENKEDVGVCSIPTPGTTKNLSAMRGFFYLKSKDHFRNREVNQYPANVVAGGNEWPGRQSRVDIESVE